MRADMRCNSFRGTPVVIPFYEARTRPGVTKDCGDDNGGCAHECNKSANKCECWEGYYLDPSDLSSCKDVDECEESNGGCAQVCNNLPGEFVCTCETGYRIDESNGKTCVDINECEDSALSWDCQGGCENLIGSYRCLPSTDGILEDTGVSIQNDDGVFPGTIKCKPGFQLSFDGSECQDINECALEDEDPQTGRIIHRFCEYKCENTKGSFRCHCPEGYHLLEDKESCALSGLHTPAPLTIKEDDAKTFPAKSTNASLVNVTRCTYQIMYLPNGNYKCGCSGYKLSEDQHSCLMDKSFCSTGKGHERCSPGTCLLREDEMDFTCKCPLGFRSEGLSCQDVNECTDGTHMCSHECQNTYGSYQCSCPQGLMLSNNFTCTDPCEPNKNGCDHMCLADKGGECSCREGYRLKNDGKSCEDVDECLEHNGSCEQMCLNLQGTHACSCDTGYKLAKDKRTCQKTNLKPRDNCRQLQKPRNGNVSCMRHIEKQFVKWNCGITCNVGYVLQGPRHRTCNYSGKWDGSETKCVEKRVLQTSGPRAELCPALKPAHNGVISPEICTKGPSKNGVNCQLKCDSGFVPIRHLQTTCVLGLGWTIKSELQCTPEWQSPEQTNAFGFLISLLIASSNSSSNQTESPTTEPPYDSRSKPARPNRPALQSAITYDHKSETRSEPAQLTSNDGSEYYIVCPDRGTIRVPAEKSVNLPQGCNRQKVPPSNRRMRSSHRHRHRNTNS
ncbi:signal peptide, CUB and EGF-like domain-containing protein 1 isoform X2 [Drosophila gunungcola]|uniref:signal peptide, CUB and EGF-like domain-containing protein 1 isoform X2 n=1 Tax=Drosophila gunungcola TaxID=103775 RepID=UPI0022E44D9A|nr:signal peptide, CUB and EGF-like domain-containing protein 1 isoform X2 [Drosophila gunungcola]